MKRALRLRYVALLAFAAVKAGAATPSWHIGVADFQYDPQTRSVGATCRGVTFTACTQVGPVLPGPAEPNADVARLVAQDTQAPWRNYRYRMTRGDQSAEFTISVRPGDDGLVVRVTSPARRFSAVSAGQTTGLLDWRRFTYMRNGEAYGQAQWPRVAYAPNQGVYVAALWDMEGSHGSSWRTVDDRFSGDGAFSATNEVVYANQRGGYAPVYEVLRVRVAPTLWSVIPPPNNPPSPYAALLARSVFLDAWDGKADQIEYLLNHLRKLTQGLTSFYTVLENWQTGGFDSLLPDSIYMPDYPPNDAIGNVQQLSALSRTARSMGSFALRTNYMLFRSVSPSAKLGRAQAATGEDGKPKWHTATAQWHGLAARQEDEIHRLFATNAGFTDQLTSGAGPWAYTDFGNGGTDTSTIGGALRLQRDLASLIEGVTRGPLGSESVMDEQLVGRWVATGDFGMYDGYHRTFTPEFKLRRLQHLTTLHGMGLMYRYYEMPPFPLFSTGRTTYLQDPDQYDDYRAAEILYGNGGYIFYTSAMPWDYMLTECLLVGALQRHYALHKVDKVEYWLDGRFVDLQQALQVSVNPSPTPWDKQPDCFQRIRVRYVNGLTVVVNRMAQPFTVDAAGTSLILPKSGWVAWTPDGKLLAYSAYAPGATDRVDYIRDDSAQMQYLNPRGKSVMGQTQPCLWLKGAPVVRLDLRTGDAWVRGESVPYRPPQAQPADHLDFQFGASAQGWTPESDFGPMRFRGGMMEADIVGEDPHMSGPPIDLAPDSVSAIVVRMRVTCGSFGQLYFRAEGANATAEEMCVRFPVTPGPEPREYRIEVGQHPLWKGHRITALRLDPEHGASPGQFGIAWLRGEK